MDEKMDARNEKMNEKMEMDAKIDKQKYRIIITKNSKRKQK